MLLNCCKESFSLKLFISEKTELDNTEQKLISQLEKNITVEYVPPLKDKPQKWGILRDIENDIEAEIIWEN